MAGAILADTPDGWRHIQLTIRAGRRVELWTMRLMAVVILKHYWKIINES